MNKRNTSTKNLFAYTCTALFVLFLMIALSSANAGLISGVVFEDKNKNSIQDTDEQGVSNVAVSNQKDVVLTDAKGKYEININEDDSIFISKPSGYALPLDENNNPKFYYIYSPKGSPPLKFRGIFPTGALPAALNFPIYKSDEPSEYEALFFADPQTRGDVELDYLRDDVINEIAGTEAAFAMTLGDIVFNDLSAFARSKKIFSMIGKPVFNVPGNHDLDHDSNNNIHAYDTFKSNFGPNYYSFNYGDVHYIALADIEWLGNADKKKNSYICNIDERQIEWVKNDLAFVDKGKLVVLTMHIPLRSIMPNGNKASNQAKRKIFEIIKDRKNVLALAGHEHQAEHLFLGKKDGFHGDEPLHTIICGATCGLWWRGPKDERGIPISDAADGTPNGYYILKINKNKYDVRFKAASKCKDFQMRISAPPAKFRIEDATGKNIVVNIFDGHKGYEVACAIDSSEPQKMSFEERADPYFKDLIAKYPNSYNNKDDSAKSAHIWITPLPADIKQGIHKIAITAKKPDGEILKETKVFEIE